MKRIVIIATLVVFAQIVAGLSQPASQTFPGTPTLRRVFRITNVRANASGVPTVGVPGGSIFIVDLTQRGVIYEFDPQAGQIDFNRIKVRTARGEFAIGSFLETTFLKDKLAGFKYTSQPFSLATRPPGTLQNPPTGTSNFNCTQGACVCTGDRDCSDLIFNTSLCSGSIFCAKETSGESHCVCIR
jgi:hypothetical protein